MTSSKISSAPSRAVILRNASRKPGAGGTQPMLPTTGSTMTEAMRSLCAWKARSTASTELKGSAMVVSAKLRGTPAVSGSPSVATPEPAFTSSESTCPW